VKDQEYWNNGMVGRWGKKKTAGLVETTPRQGRQTKEGGSHNHKGRNAKREKQCEQRKTENRSGYSRAQALLALQDLFQDSNKWRQVLHNCVPKDIQIDIKVRMDQTMSHPDDVCPRYQGKLFAGVFRDLARSFPDHFNRFEKSKYKLAVMLERASILTFCE